jgi:hypothetical protein
MIKPVSDRRQAWEPREWEDEGGRCSLASRPNTHTCHPCKRERERKHVKRFIGKWWLVPPHAKKVVLGRALREREREIVGQSVCRVKERALTEHTEMCGHLATRSWQISFAVDLKGYVCKVAACKGASLTLRRPPLNLLLPLLSPFC